MRPYTGWGLLHLPCFSVGVYGPVLPFIGPRFLCPCLVRPPLPPPSAGSGFFVDWGVCAVVCMRPSGLRRLAVFCALGRTLGMVW